MPVNVNRWIVALTIMIPTLIVIIDTSVVNVSLDHIRGCLQMILDRERTVDWFSSEFIVWLSIMSATALILFIIVELFAEHPIVNLRALKNFSFSLGNVIIFFVLFNLYGSIVLLPIYLQTLMDYTATLAGIVLAPGGIAALITMPIAGVLINRINPKAIIAFGVVMLSYSTLLMSMFNRMADFNTMITATDFYEYRHGIYHDSSFYAFLISYKERGDGECYIYI